MLYRYLHCYAVALLFLCMAAGEPGYAQDYTTPAPVLETSESVLTRVKDLIRDGKFTEAEEALQYMILHYPENADAWLLQGNLYYYRGDISRAGNAYQYVLMLAPEYHDAQDALTRLKQQAQAEAHPEAPPPLRYQLDTGVEHSRLSRTTLKNWHSEFVQFGYQANAATRWHGLVEQSHQFASNDTYLETGVDHRFSRTLNGYIGVGATPKADYRPRTRLLAGGAAQLTAGIVGTGPLWATLDTRYDTYAATNVKSLTPGLQWFFWKENAFSAKTVQLWSRGEKRMGGYALRLDVHPDKRLGVFIGYSDAPDTENGVTSNTRSWALGSTIDLTDRLTLRLTLTEDARERSYRREVVSSGLSYRF